MGILAWLIVGAIAGWLASIVMKTNAQQGLLMDIIVGIVGALIGGFVLNTLNIANANPGNDPTAFNWLSLVTAFLGAVILLAIMKAVRRTT
jgi:uncharacterized membrane protein YeaQ/YmgE (transglycosylase-associated protein family)